MKVEEQINHALAGLKDFQRETVEVATRAFCDGQSRFLIADEVGLGKTIVAKGIIAKMVAERLESKKMLNVIYICSNQALAKQNLAKLSFVTIDGDKDTDYDKVINRSDLNDRITSLAYQEYNPKNKYGLHIKALTPATSFDIRSLGRSEERLLLFQILISYKEFENRGIALKWFLKGKKSAKNWNEEINPIIKYKSKAVSNSWKIRKSVFALFKKELKKPLDQSKFKKLYSQFDIKKESSLWNILLSLLTPGRHNSTYEKKISQKRLQDIFSSDHFNIVIELRIRLAVVCKEFLKADLYILDEFQRFSSLIQNDDDIADSESGLAKMIFEKANAKVLMLSATPFKAYTTKFEETLGENHFEEFRTVLKFLMRNVSDEEWTELNKWSNEYFRLFRNFENTDESLSRLKDVKEKIEEKYRQFIARTERTLVQEFNPKDVDDAVEPIVITKDDIIDFVSTDEIIKTINQQAGKKLPVPTEYVKSSPFPFSFLQDYEHMKVFESVFPNNPDLQKTAKKAKRAWLPVDRIQDYKALLPESKERIDNEPNGKLRKLYDKTVRNKGWQLLWIPPSLPYYKVRGAFSNTESFTKTLIFSAWKMVPRMVSALVSYEAERLSVGKYLLKHKEEKAGYHLEDQKQRFPRPLLNYRNRDGSPSGMNNLMLFYPSLYLSRIFDPEANLFEKKTLTEIKNVLASDIKKRLIELGVKKIGDMNGDIQKWDWYALLLLDKHEQNNSDLHWINRIFSNDDQDVESEIEKKENGSGGKWMHYLELKKCLLDKNYVPNVSILSNEKLSKIAKDLAELAIGSPANCCARALQKNYLAEPEEIFYSAFLVGLGFNSFFNKPESISIINEFSSKSFYHENVLQYCISGNIQSMLDEYIYQLKDSGAQNSPRECANSLSSVLAVSSGSIEAKTISENEKPKILGFSIRTHYAIPFGLNNSSDLKVGNRQIKVREAFNSPFRPFVLTSTSIGQEGLDFHYYCSSLIHWNLPTNPIDLEQREGRIKRFKGLNIRRNIAEKYRNKLVEYGKNIWDQLYSIAEENKSLHQCDLVPFWHMPGEITHKTDVMIPIYLYSKDFDKLKHIKDVLRNYRLTFGQPRQEELIEALSGKLSDEDLSIINRELFINLSPISYKKKRND